MKTINLIYKDNKKFKSQLKEIPYFGYKSILVQIFAADENKKIIKQIVKDLYKHFENPIIIGSVTAGSISEGEIYDQDIVVSLSLFKDTQILPFSKDTNQSFSLKNFTRNIVQKDTKAIILFSDGFNNFVHKFIKQIYLFKNDLLIAGGKSSNHFSNSQNFVFNGKDFYKNGIVGVALNNKNLVARNHFFFDWSTVGKYMTVTKSSKNRLYEVDNETAFDIYKKYLGEEVVNLFPETNQFPVVLERNGIKIARDIIDSFEDGSVLLAGEVEEGEKIQFGCGNKYDIINNFEKKFKRIINNPIESFFLYSCVARRNFLGKEIVKEIKPFSKIKSTSGFFTFGEVFVNNDIAEIFNETLTVLTLSESKKKVNKQKAIEFFQKDGFFDKEKSNLSKNQLAIQSLSQLIKVTSNEFVYLNQNLKKRAEELEKTKKELQENEKKFRTFYENIPGGILIIDSNYLIKDVNNRTCEITGYKKEELIGELCDIVCPKGSKSKQCPIWEKGNTCFKNMDTAIKCKSGFKSPILKNAQIISLEGKSYILESYQDIYEFKKLQSELLQSEQKYRSIIENMQDVYYRTDLEGRFVMISNSGVKFFGENSEKKILGKKIKNFYANPKDRTYFLEKLNKYSRLENEELVLKDKNNNIKDVMVNSNLVVENDQIVGVEGTIKDITDKKIGEEYLKSSNKISKLLLESKDFEVLYEVIKELGRNANVTRSYIFQLDFENGNIKNSYKWTNDEKLKNCCSERKGEGIPINISVYWLLNNLEEKGNICISNIYDFPLDEKIRDMFIQQGVISILFTPLYYNGKISGFVGFDEYEKERDWDKITINYLESNTEHISAFIERKETENKLIDLNQNLEKKVEDRTFKLKQANKAKDEFLNIASHELRTPMTIIKGYLSMFLEGDIGNLGEESKKYIKKLYNNSDRMISLINDMLDVQKLESGKMEFYYEKFYIKDLLEEVYQDIVQLAKRKQQNIVLDIKNNDLEINSDYYRLVQVFVNLLNNAIKFTPENGNIKIVSRSKNGYLLVDIIDDGIGMNSDNVGIIFEKFGQLDNHLSHSSQGTGLGLSIVKVILENLGGGIDVESELGRGSIFTAFLPL